jgi:hypothetical protein
MIKFGIGQAVRRVEDQRPWPVKKLLSGNLSERSLGSGAIFRTCPGNRPRATPAYDMPLTRWSST